MTAIAPSATETHLIRVPIHGSVDGASSRRALEEESEYATSAQQHRAGEDNASHGGNAESTPPTHASREHEEDPARYGPNGATMDARRVVSQHYLTRTISQQGRRGSRLFSRTYASSFRSREDDSFDTFEALRRGEKRYAVHPNCLLQLTLFYDNDAEDDIHNGDLEAMRNDEDRRQLLQNLVPSILRQIGVSWEEFNSTMHFFQLRLLAWKGRRIILTMFVVMVAGEVFVFTFFAESGYVLLFSLLMVFVPLWITDHWLNAEMMEINEDAKIIFAAFKPQVMAVFTRVGQRAGISPRYMLKLKLTRPSVSANRLTHLEQQHIRRQREEMEASISGR